VIVDRGRPVPVVPPMTTDLDDEHVGVTPRPWQMTSEQVASAEEAVRGLVGPDVARLLRPVLRIEHAPLVEALNRLAWDLEPMDVVADRAMHILLAATVPGGVLDPVDDEIDVPWAGALGRMVGAPLQGTKIARQWFAHLERSLWEGVLVSPVVQATAAYCVAYFEDAVGHDYSRWRWVTTAGIVTDLDERHGLGVTVVVRAAKLLSWGTT